MNTVAEIETAVERLPEPQVTELAAWLEQHRQRRAIQPPVEKIGSCTLVVPHGPVSLLRT